MQPALESGCSCQMSVIVSCPHLAAPMSSHEQPPYFLPFLILGEFFFHGFAVPQSLQPARRPSSSSPACVRPSDAV